MQLCEEGSVILLLSLCLDSLLAKVSTMLSLFYEVKTIKNYVFFKHVLCTGYTRQNVGGTIKWLSLCGQRSLVVTRHVTFPRREQSRQTNGAEFIDQLNGSL